MKNLGKILLVVFGILVYISYCSYRSLNNDIVIHTEEGLNAFNDGDIVNAIYSFRQVLSNPMADSEDKSLMYLNLCIAYKNLGEIDSALYYANLGISSSISESYNYHIHSANVGLINENVPAVLEHLTRATELKPSEDWAFYNLGAIYLGKYGEEYTDYEKSLENFSKAYSLEQDLINKEHLAYSQMMANQYDAAEEHYETLVEYKPDDLIVSFYLGICKYMLEKESDAEEIWNRIISIDSSYSEVINEFIEGD